MMVTSTAADNFADNALMDANIPTGVMTSLARHNRIRDAFSPRALAGLGNDGSCPDSAPYAVPGWPGRCSNTKDGGLAPASNPVTEYVSAPVYNTGIAQQNSEARFGLQLTEDRATQDALAAEAEAQGRAQGYSVVCQVTPNWDAVANKNYYTTDCTVNGQPGHAAALLIRPGGWDITRVEANLPASAYHAPVVTTPAPATTTNTQQSQAAGGGNAQVAVAQSYPTGVLTMQPNTQGQTTGSGAAPAGPGSITGEGFITSALSQPVVLIGLAAVAFFMFKGKH